ncbi:serine incorporator 3-like isoform X2 [Homarus americanus]|uniref:serine incorporator 3-like isoform X2 n=1 Tax=Homarus americanus TaxID=6706 RepID=UPI001C44AA58|nr:serine incorporator 3-like isoform X2 [Homarus americanus]
MEKKNILKVGCMCGTSSCRFCCRLCPSVLESTSTRIVYIVFLMLSVGVMALMMSLRVQDAIMEMFPDHDEVCEWIGAGENCEVALGYMAVYRLGFAVTAYHFLLMLITCGVKSSRDCRAGLHNGMWFYKFLLLMFFCFGSFFIPDPNDLFINVWMYTAMSGAGLFIVIQLLLLVFLFHSWTDKLVARVNNGGSSICWYGVFAVTATVFIYIVFAGSVCLLYYFFAATEGCNRNRWFILINAAACVFVSVVTVAKPGPKDVRLRLLHSSLISLYVIYLTWTAIGSAPRKFQKIDVGEKLGIWIGAGHDVRSNILLPEQEYYCGPNGKEESWADEVLPYVSLILTFFLVVYSAIGTATPDNCQAIEFPSCPSRQSVQRHDVEDVGGQKVIRNESNDLAYSYPLFHIMLGLATLYLMMSLTDWYTPSTARLITFGRSWSAVWIKMSSSWVCLLIYLTVTLFPTMLPNKTSRTGPINGTISNGYAGSFRGSARSLDDEAAVPLSPSKPTTTIHQETTV